jgi:guanylate kinase/adenylate cyclase class IV
MKKNQEIKFITDCTQTPKDVLREIGVFTERRMVQEDIYSFSNDQFFKLRVNDNIPVKFLRYNRLTSPVIRESQYEAYELIDKSAQDAARFAFENIQIAGTVKKHRQQFEAKNILLNIDTVYSNNWKTELYRVVEIEYYDETISAEESIRDVRKILDWFGVRPFELLPYSNIHMVNMLMMSFSVRPHLEGESKGKLTLIDGGSGTGKSTIKELLINSHRMGYARRETTRAPRPDDTTTNDYRFVSSAEFNRSALLGEYIEFRDFLFGMSYGLPWKEFIAPLSQGQNMMALINLGNGYFTKRLFPSARLVLLYADVDTIRQRLHARGSLTREQVEERIENNRLATSYIDAYDLAIDTSKYSAEEVARKIVSPD